MALWDQITVLYASANDLFNRFIVAFVIFLVGLVLGRLAGNFVTKILKELEVGKVVKKATKKKTKIERNVGKIVSWVIYIFAAIIALDQLGLTTPLLTWMGIALLVLVVLAFALGIKDYIPNLMAGFVIQTKSLFKEGDDVSVADVQGTVVRIGLVETELKNKGDHIFVPNATFTEQKLHVKKS